MVASSVLGFPRIGELVYNNFHCHRSEYAPTGKNREVKKAVEAYWAGKISADELQTAAAEVRKSNWTTIKAHGVDYVPR
jgi:5-methyltetrahydropteroyltriglutamate--homocysteine methyltransferase